MLVPPITLQEILDKPGKIEWQDKASATFTVKDHVGDLLDYSLSLDQEGMDGEPLPYGVFDVVFRWDQWRDGKTGFVYPAPTEMGISKIGLKAASRVFASVLKILKTVLSKGGVQGFTFAAKEPSRRKLYRTMLRMLAPKLGLSVSQEYDAGRFMIFFIGKPGTDTKARLALTQTDPDLEREPLGYGERDESMTSQSDLNHTSLVTELFDDTETVIWNGDVAVFTVSDEDTQKDYNYQVQFSTATHLGWVEDAVYSSEDLEDFYIAQFFLKSTRDHVNGRVTDYYDYGIVKTSLRVAGRVFATVMESLSRFGRAMQAHGFIFSAHEPSRQKLYKTMVAKMAAGYGYKDSAHFVDSKGDLQVVVAKRGTLPKMQTQDLSVQSRTESVCVNTSDLTRQPLRTQVHTEASLDLSQAAMKALRLIANAKDRSSGGWLQVGTKDAPKAIIKILRERSLITVSTESDSETKRGRVTHFVTVLAKITKAGLAFLADQTQEATTTANIAAYPTPILPPIKRTPLKLGKKTKQVSSNKPAKISGTPTGFQMFVRPDRI